MAAKKTERPVFVVRFKRVSPEIAMYPAEWRERMQKWLRKQRKEKSDDE